MSDRGINWGVLADWASNPARFEYEGELQRKIREALAIREQREQAAAARSAAGEQASTPAPSDAAMPEPVVAAPKPPDNVAALSAALDATSDDAERAALLAAAPREVREQLNARLMYLKLVSDSHAAVAADHQAYAAFSALLDVAEDDAARVAIIRGAAPDFVVKWREHITDTEESARRRYLARIAGDGSESVDAS